MMWGWHGDIGFGGGWIAMSVVMVAFWVLVIWGVVALIRSASRQPGTGKREPEEILAERFSAGEIDEAEYESRLHVLQARGRGGAG